MRKKIEEKLRKKIEEKKWGNFFSFFSSFINWKSSEFFLENGREKMKDIFEIFFFEKKLEWFKKHFAGKDLACTVPGLG